MRESLINLYTGLRNNFKFGYGDMPETVEEFINSVQSSYGFRATYETHDGWIFGEALVINCNQRLQEIYCTARSITPQMREFLGKQPVKICYLGHY